MHQIKHFVVLMLENRSFDNLLGWLYNDTDNRPAHFIPPQPGLEYAGLLESTLEEYTNELVDESGAKVFDSPPIKGIPSVEGAKYRNSPRIDPHEKFEHVTRQIFGSDEPSKPTMKGFLQDYATKWPPESEWQQKRRDISAIMETYTEAEAPILYGLARHYAVSDMWFASVPTQTNPNRAFMACGTSQGQINNENAFDLSRFDADTIWNRLSSPEFETSWSVFWEENFPPVISHDGCFTRRAFEALNRIPDVDRHFKKMDEFHKLARTGRLPGFSFIEPAWTLEEKKFGQLEGFQGNEYHPPGDIRPGEDFLGNVYTSLIANKEAWDSTLLLVTFDEHGGLFDHVPPRSATPPDGCKQHGFGFDRFGVRVPTLLISPWIARKTVLRSDNPKVPFDHTSIPATVLGWKDPDRSKWNLGARVDVAPTFDGVLTLTTPRDDPSLAPRADVREPGESNVVRFDEPFCLRNEAGRYLARAKRSTVFHGHKWFPTVGPRGEKAILEFAGGGGTVTHGSTTRLRTTESSVGEGNLLGAFMKETDCYYHKNEGDSRQRWTIKSVERPYLGEGIRFGDRVRIENRYNLNPVHWLAQALVESGEWVTTKEGSMAWWVIERP